MSSICLNTGVHIRWKGSEVSPQPDRGAGMYTSAGDFLYFSLDSIFICGYTFKVECVQKG